MLIITNSNFLHNLVLCKFHNVTVDKGLKYLTKSYFNEVLSNNTIFKVSVGVEGFEEERRPELDILLKIYLIKLLDKCIGVVIN